MQMMDVSLVPTLKPTKALHDRVIAVLDPRAENAGTVTLELCSHQRNDLI